MLQIGIKHLTETLTEEDANTVFTIVEEEAIGTLANDMSQAISDAQTDATNSQLEMWEAEARRLTADSYATEPEDTFVKVYTSNGDGTFTATNTTEYSALHWRIKSGDSETASANSATQAGNSASNAGDSATASANSANESANHATQAGSYSTSIQNLLDAFDDRYLGAKASNPTLDNDGNPLIDGALYWNTTTNSMNTYNGVSWEQWSVSVTLDTTQEVTAEKTFSLSPIIPTENYGDDTSKASSTNFVDKAVNPEITYVSEAQHNNLMVVIGGKLYTASGDSASNNNDGTGRGLDAGHFEYGVTNLREVTFPDLPAGVKLVEAKGMGYSINYALFDNGWLYTWGYNHYGVCGLGHTARVPIPTLAATDCVKVWSKLVQSYQISYQTLVIQKTDGYVYATGRNGDGSFGLNDATDRNTFTQLTWIGQNPKFVSFCSSYGSSIMAQKADGTIWSCGNNASGCLFDGTTTHTWLPVEVTNNIGGSTAGDLVFHHREYGYYNTQAYTKPSAMIMRRTSGGVTSVYTVGDNSWGQVGNGTTTVTTTPYAVPNMSDVADIDQLGGGVPTRRVLKTNGYLYCWGHNGQGQVGNGSVGGSVLSPTLVATGVQKLLGRTFCSHTYPYYMNNFILKTDGKTYGCGENSTYYLGLGVTGNLGVFTHVSMLPHTDPVKMIGSFTTTSYGRTLVAVTESNNMYYWGYNAQYGCHPHNTNPIRYPEKLTLEGGIR